MDTKQSCNHSYVGSHSEVWIRSDLSDRMKIEVEYCFLCGDVKAIDINIVDKNNDRIERKFKYKE